MTFLLTKTIKLCCPGLFLIFFFYSIAVADNTTNLGLGVASLDGPDADPTTPELDLVAGSQTTLTITYTAGSSGIPVGGVLKIVYFLQGAPYSGVFQASNPIGPNYVTAVTSSSSTLMTSGTIEGSCSVIFITVNGSALLEGDIITVVVGDTRWGGSGWAVQRNAGRAVIQFFPNSFLIMYPRAFRVLLALDGKTYQDIDENRLPLNILPKSVVDIRIAARTNAVIGEPSRIVIMMHDGYGNFDHLFEGTVNLSCTDSEANLPESVEFDSNSDGRIILNDVVFNTPGVHRISAIVPGTSVSGTSNAVICSTEPPYLRIFWGDLHVHTVVSDGMETQDKMFEYAREISGFDFQGTSEHSWDTASAPIIDAETTQQVIAAYQPGIFTSIKGFEWANFAIPMIGHHNVHYRTTNPPVLPCLNGPYIQWTAFFNEVAKYDAIIIPHHPAKAILENFYKHWDYHSVKQERLVEIYSTHGNNEYQGNPRPVDLQRAGCNVQDALCRGYKLGIVGGSDSHTTRPGCVTTDMIYRPGITAVYAPSNTMEDIWLALWNRRCYATTGERIVLEFTINGEMMGGEIPLKQNEPVNIYVRAIGQSTISRIDIIKGHVGDTRPLPAAYTILPNNVTAEFNWTDNAPPSDCFYYVRVTQTNGEMAWSSPIWVNPSLKAINIIKDEFTGSITVNWNSLQYHAYDIYYKDSYDAPWILAESNMPGSSNGNSSWIDDGSKTVIHPANIPQRYYTVIGN